MRRKEYINKIVECSSRFVLEVEGFTTLNQYDINIHAENFLIPILNIIFDVNLKNLNTEKKNYPAIDLADLDKGIAFQITSTNEVTKIEETLEKFFKHELNKQFNTLYIYILTQKKISYNETRINKLLKNGFKFDTSLNVIDSDSMLEKINAITSTSSLELLAKHYTHEFSDTQIEMRRKDYQGGYLKSEPENISPNLLKITFPNKFYKADLKFDEVKILEDLNVYLISIQKRPIKTMTKQKLIRKALKHIECEAWDWITHENCLYTFKNLNDDKEPYSKIIDKGTITEVDCEQFFGRSDANLRTFKNLLRSTLRQFCQMRGIEWFSPRKIFRFANNQALPNLKRVSWQGKNKSTKTVIFEMFNKKEKHIICYRSLAFKSSFINIADDWYLVLKPTWSFTNPGGYKESRFESAYMSGLKRLENNNAVFNYFRFFGYYLSYADLFTLNYPYLKINPHFSLTIIPRLEEITWNPLKIIERPIDAPDVDLKDDIEILDNTLFD